MSYTNANNETVYDYDDENDIKNLLVGQSIVSTSVNEYKTKATITLSNGKVLNIEANQGYCCANGDFLLEVIGDAENNVIMSVKVENRKFKGEDAFYNIFVYTAGMSTSKNKHKKSTVVSSVGSAGDNEMYGMGYSFTVSEA